MNKATYDQLRALTRDGDRVPKECKRVKRILCIDKELKLVRYYEKGTQVRVFDARFGGPGTRTRVGSFKVFRKKKDDYSTLYQVVMKDSMYFDGGIAVHYSKFFDAVGYNGASGGCVNIGDRKESRWMFRRTPIGTRVLVYD